MMPRIHSGEVKALSVRPDLSGCFTFRDRKLLKLNKSCIRELNQLRLPSHNFAMVRQPLFFFKISSECCIFWVDGFDSLLPAPDTFYTSNQLPCVCTTMTTMEEARSITNNLESMIFTQPCPECFTHTPSVFTISCGSNIILQVRKIGFPSLKLILHFYWLISLANNSLRYCNPHLKKKKILFMAVKPNPLILPLVCLL